MLGPRYPGPCYPSPRYPENLMVSVFVGLAHCRTTILVLSIFLEQSVG